MWLVVGTSSSGAQWCFLMAIPSLTSCSPGYLAMTPALVLLQWFNPAMPALNSQVQVCTFPLSCQGLWGHHLISLFQIPLSWRISLCYLALPSMALYMLE